MERFRVLIVEDNPVIRDLFILGMDKLQEQLKQDEPRFEVTQAEDGGTAWQHIVEKGADLVVVDLYLPVLSGLDLIKRIRENPATQSVRVLAISASIHDARDRSLGAGADRFLQKPLRLVDLLEAIRALLHLEPV
jgi:CheY-like chemotaxis protein